MERRRSMRPRGESCSASYFITWVSCSKTSARLESFRRSNWRTANSRTTGSQYLEEGGGGYGNEETEMGIGKKLELREEIRKLKEKADEGKQMKLSS